MKVPKLKKINLKQLTTLSTKVRLGLSAVILLIGIGVGVYALQSPKTVHVEPTAEAKPSSAQVVKVAPSSTGSSTPAPAASTPAPTPVSTPAAAPKPVSTGPSAAQLAYDCTEYQAKTNDALNSAVDGIDSSTYSAVDGAEAQTYSSTGAEDAAIDQIYTSGNAALQSAYSSYVNGFSPGVPDCSPASPAPVSFTLL